MEISARILRRKRACVSQVKEFINVFGKANITITKKLCIAHAQIFNWDWAAENLLPSRLYADYEAKRAPLYADLVAKLDLLYVAYEAKRAPLYVEHAAKRAPLDADYEAKSAPLYAVLEAKRAGFDADYEAELAALFGQLAERT